MLGTSKNVRVDWRRNTILALSCMAAFTATHRRFEYSSSGDWQWSHFISTQYNCSGRGSSTSQHWPLPGQYVTLHMQTTYLSLINLFFNRSDSCNIGTRSYWCGGSMLSWQAWDDLQEQWISPLKPHAQESCRELYSSQTWDFQAPLQACDSRLQESCSTPGHLCQFGWAFFLDMEFHVAGRTAVRISQRSQWNEVVAASRDIHWGFYHGAVAEVTRLLARDVPLSLLGNHVISRFCPENTPWYSAYHCSHGIGHGAGLVTFFGGLSPENGGLICNNINDDAAARSCFLGGYSMELQSAYGLYTLHKQVGARLFIGPAAPLNDSESSDLRRRQTEHKEYNAYMQANRVKSMFATDRLNFNYTNLLTTPDETSRTTERCQKMKGCNMLLHYCHDHMASEKLFVLCVADFVDTITMLVYIHLVLPFEAVGMLDLPHLGTYATQKTVSGLRFRREELLPLFATPEQRIANMCHLRAISCRAQDACKMNPGFQFGYRLKAYEFDDTPPIPCGR